MQKKFAALAVGVGLLINGWQISSAEAGRGTSSSGRSFSSSSHSFSSGSHSLSSGSHSSTTGSKSFSGAIRTSSSSSAGRSYSSGKTSSGRNFSSGGPSVVPKGFSHPSGSNFGSSSSAGRSNKKASVGVSSATTKSRSPAPGPSRSYPSGASPSGRSYSSGTPGTSALAGSGRFSITPSGRRFSNSSYDSAAGAAMRRQESMSAYRKGSAPQPTFADTRGTARPIDPADRRVEQLRKQLDEEQWTNRELRRQQSFGNYSYPSYGVPTYRDPYGNFFWSWLIAQSLDTRAYWAYNHRDYMDDARYRDLLTRDAQLGVRIRELESQGVRRDPTYTPGGIDPDLMYSDNYVEAVYNPQAPPQIAPAVAAHPTGRSIWRGLFDVMLVVGLMAAGVWLVFIKRWGGT